MPHIVRNLASFAVHTWFTGLLYIAGGFGYLFYAILWTIRFLQMRKTLAAITGVAIVLIAAVYYMLFVPRTPHGDQIALTIAPGMNLRAIAAKLEQRGIIRSQHALILWMRAIGNDTKIQAGKLTLLEKESVFSASKKLLDVKAIEIAATIPEGLIIEQTASILHRSLGIDSAVFVKLCSDSAYIAKASPGATSLEGYLFPDTYRFSPGITAREIIQRMLDRFEEAYQSLQPDPVAAPYARRGIVTLASIVEKEAALAEERPRIAGVFYNRLRAGVPLGADPTVRYILRKFDGQLRVSELNNPSPYNTRRFAGLPPGPICSPGLSSLQAAAAPLATNELYFVAKWDGSGAHDFSKSYREHDRKKLSIRQRTESRKRAAERGLR